MRERYNRLVEDAIEFLIYSKQFVENEKDKSLIANLQLMDMNYMDI